MHNIDPEEPEQIAAAFGIATQLAQEIVYMNDEGYYSVTPQERWLRMRGWVVSQIKEGH